MNRTRGVLMIAADLMAAERKANTTTDGRLWNYGWLRQFFLPMKREVNKFDGKRIKEFSR